ncbi:MAG: hypothetical protein CSA04_05510 [Bacteroidetes bacterium]|nr:MAG: hypothetical protein CSA04_05510 [Bacteroidota bacterium]
MPPKIYHSARAKRETIRFICYLCGSMKKRTSTLSRIESLFSHERNFWLVVFLFPFVLYWNTAYNKYSLDDHLVIEHHEQVQKGLRGIPEIITSPYAEEEGLQYGYRPIVKIAYAIEYALWGEHPGLNHLMSVLWFALTMMVLFRLLRRLFPEGNRFFILLIVLLYSAHPLHTEIVASLKNRDEIFMLFFAFLAFLQSLRYAQEKRIGALLYAGLFFVLALLSKNTAVPFLAIIPLGMYYAGAKRKELLHVALLFSSLLITAYILYKALFTGEIRTFQYYENPLFFEHGFSLRTGTSAYILLYYLRLILFPHPLSFYYGYDQLSLHELLSFPAIASILIHLALLFIAIKGIKKRTPISLGVWIYLLGIVAYSNFFFAAPGIIADRFAILALLGFILILVSLFFTALKMAHTTVSVPRKQRNLLLLMAGIILLPYAIKTFRRNQDWRTYLSLYEADIPHLSNSVKANMLYAQALTWRFYYNNQLGVDLRKNEEFIEKIKRHYHRALELYPKNYEALNNFGGFYAHNINQYEEAIPWLEKAIAVDKEKPEAWFNLGFSYTKTARYQEAERAYKKALEINPDYWEVKSALGELYFQQGALEKAIALNKEIINAHPDNLVPYTNIGNYYIYSSDTLSAMRFWEKSVETFPHKQLLINLSYLYKQYGDQDKSIQYYRYSEKTNLK